jgi:uncharacterized membrane protein
VRTISLMAVRRRGYLRLGPVAAALAALVVAGAAPPASAFAELPAASTVVTPSAGFHGFVLAQGHYASFDVPGPTTKTIAGGTNNRGQIVGGYTDASGEHGFVRDTHGEFTRIDVPRARSTSATKINDRGQVVGFYTQFGPLEGPDAAPRRGYLLDQGQFVRLDVPGAVDTQATGINNHEQVVGQYLDTDGTFHGFVWQRGRFRTIDAPGAAATSLIDIDDHGQLLGVRVDPDGTFTGFVLDRGRYTTFAVPGAVITVPFDINNGGQIVGVAYSDPAATVGRGFLLRNGVEGSFTPVNFPGATTTVVGGINDRGKLVGGYRTDDPDPGLADLTATFQADGYPSIPWPLRR